MSLRNYEMEQLTDLVLEKITNEIQIELSTGQSRQEELERLRKLLARLIYQWRSPDEFIRTPLASIG